jgi:hypothetical protein
LLIVPLSTFCRSLESRGDLPASDQEVWSEQQGLDPLWRVPPQAGQARGRPRAPPPVASKSREAKAFVFLPPPSLPFFPSSYFDCLFPHPSVQADASAFRFIVMRVVQQTSRRSPSSLSLSSSSETPSGARPSSRASSTRIRNGSICGTSTSISRPSRVTSRPFGSSRSCPFFTSSSLPGPVC